MARVGIVICNYNKAEMVCQCIASVLESRYTEYQLYVVDNASTDHSVPSIQKRFGSKVHLVRNAENLGGSGGFNTGMRSVLEADDAKACRTGCEYIWCLDNDVLVDENALGVLVEFLDTHPECGMAGSKVYHMEAPDYVQQYGLTVDFENFCVEAGYRNHLEDGTLPEVVYSDAAAACSLLVRCSLIREIGLMPEDNFLYWDDTEWGYRCKQAGYEVASCGKSIVLHAMGAKKEQEDNTLTYYAWRNWIDFFARYTPRERLGAMCQTFLQEIFDIIYEGVYRDETGKAMTVMSAYDDALHGVRGKAAADRIFPVKPGSDRLKNILDGKRCVCIEARAYESDAGQLADQIARLFPQMEITLLHQDQSAEYQNKDTQDDTTVICMCGSVFQEEDLSLSRIYADPDGNFLATQEDAMMIINYPFSRRMFFSSQMSLFLRCVLERRRKFQSVP